MKLRQPIIKLVSIIMLFVMMQKIAGGLYLHNWLHVSKNVAFAAHGEKEIGQYNCSCIDDFYIPFTEPSTFSIQVPVPGYTDYFIVPENALPVVSKYFHSLRAPPVA